MRKLLLTAVLLVAGGPAFASSIEVVGSAAPKNTSIVVMKCTNCPAPKVAEDAKAYKVPQVAPGSQAAEIIEVDGEKKLKRAEAWLGGFSGRVHQFGRRLVDRRHQNRCLGNPSR